MDPSVHIEPAIRSILPQLKLGVLFYRDCTIASSPAEFQDQFRNLTDRLRSEYDTASIGQLPSLSAWREAFKRLGVSPSRYRPSAEALLRRVLKGDEPFGVNSAVDVNNFFSLKYLLPFGIYDRDALHPPVTCTSGKEEDRYPGINGREVSMRDKLLLRDERGPFGSPYVDSQRTQVTEKTTRCLQVVFSLQPEEELEDILQTVGTAFTGINGGTVEGTAII